MGVDRSDFIYREYKNGDKERLYRHFCDQCGADRGYILLCKIQGIWSYDRHCKGCRGAKTSIKNKGKAAWNKGIPQTEEVRRKLSAALTGKPGATKGRPASLETRIKLSCVNRGISVEQFNGFLNDESSWRSRFKELGLAKACFEKYNFTCQKCGTHGCNLNAHHIYSWASFPDKRYDLDNLICLCITCHRKFHKLYGNGLKEPNTKLQMDEFLENTI